MKWIKHNRALVLLFVAAIITSIVFIVLDVLKGWDGNKTITYLFSLILFAAGVSIYTPLSDYVISHSKDMIKSNNELYNWMNNLECTEKLGDLQFSMDRKEKESCLKEINSFLKKKNEHHIDLTHDNVFAFFENNQYLKPPYNFGLDDTANSIALYNDYLSKSSIEFEKLYANYKSGDLIRLKPFPLFNVILPFFLAAIGLFATVYQYIQHNETIKNSLITYFVVFAEIMIIGFMYTWRYSKSLVSYYVNRNKKIMSLIQK